MTDDDRRRRTAANQALFRNVNDRIEELNAVFDSITPYGSWSCECGSMGCLVRVELTMQEYASVREHATRFLVAPGDAHVVSDIERVVERNVRYWVVEKIGVAAQVAEATEANRA